MLNCLDYVTITNVYHGIVVENNDGTVSVFMPSGDGGFIPYSLNKPCCQFIKEGYIFDIETQKCRWSPVNVSGCSINNVFKVVLNPKGNDGTLFFVEDNDNCFLNIEFDYLFKINCDTIVDILNGPPSSIESALLNQILDLQNQINDKLILCNSYSNQITILSGSYTSTSYSINCQTIPVDVSAGNSVGTTSTGIGNTGFLPSDGSVSSNGVIIGNGGTTSVSSGFGNIGNIFIPFSFDISGSGGALGSSSAAAVQAGQNYCLTPNGLAKWLEILGSVRYNNFIQGDINSFTCADVMTIFDANTLILNFNLSIIGSSMIAQEPVLLIPCNTPFGTKTNILKQINDLILLQIDCNNELNSLSSQLVVLTENASETSCSNILNIFETFDVSLTLDVVTSASTLQTILELPLFPAIGHNNLYNYLSGNPKSGFYICGDSLDCIPLSLNLTGTPKTNSASCNTIADDISLALFNESGLSGSSFASEIFASNIASDALASQWLHFSTGITDTNIIKLIANNKIKLSLKINHSCGDFCILIDEISLNKVCTHIERNNIFLSQSPGFELERIRDNKKSWINNTTLNNREFLISNNLGNNSIRQTNYDVNDDRLVINSKEIDLDISLASAIETDVWCYIVDNPCLLSATCTPVSLSGTCCNPCAVTPCCDKTFQDDECFEFMDSEVYEFMDSSLSPNCGNSNCCGDEIEFNELLTQPLSGITTIEDFEYFLTSELIDVKNRQTLSGYPTLRALYDRYMDSRLYCDTYSSRFNYLTMEQFASLIGNYWVDIVEQVIPATTIWGSVKIYSNTIFDQQKFKYRAYSSLFCNNPFSGKTISSPINGTNGMFEDVSLSLTPITIVNGNDLIPSNPITTYCNNIYIAQMNTNSEFIGTVTIIGQNGSN